MHIQSGWKSRLCKLSQLSKCYDHSLPLMGCHRKLSPTMDHDLQVMNFHNFFRIMVSNMLNQHPTTPLLMDWRKGPYKLSSRHLNEIQMVQMVSSKNDSSSFCPSTGLPHTLLLAFLHPNY